MTPRQENTAFWLIALLVGAGVFVAAHPHGVSYVVGAGVVAVFVGGLAGAVGAAWIRYRR